MRYLRNWNLWLENLETNDSDTLDIKKAKEKLNTLRKQIDEFNSKYKDIDTAYKTNDDKKISDMEKNLQNEFLVKYLNIAKKSRQVDKDFNQIAIDNLEIRKSQDILNITTDNKTKDKYNNDITKLKQKIQNTKAGIEEKKVDMVKQFNDIQKEMDDREKEMIEYINKIEKDSDKKY
jgi:chromosome segregation ATPase